MQAFNPLLQSLDHHLGKKYIFFAQMVRVDACPNYLDRAFTPPHQSPNQFLQRVVRVQQHQLEFIQSPGRCSHLVMLNNVWIFPKRIFTRHSPLLFHALFYLWTYEDDLCWLIRLAAYPQPDITAGFGVAYNTLDFQKILDFLTISR